VNLQADSLRLSYGGATIVHDLSLAIRESQVTVIIGPNACGKSTLLRALARLLKPRAGTVLLDGREIYEQPTKEVATKLAILPQTATAPEGLTVEDLIARGRFPHQGLFSQWSTQDQELVEEAMELTGTVEFRSRPIDQLSGGQRQRVWIALALAQDTPVMLLDEPTTYLDLAHRIEVLELLAMLNAVKRRTIVMVLHELNEACRYAQHLVAMKAGRIVAQGTPGEVINAELLETVFGLACQVVPDPVTGTPLCVPAAPRDWERLLPGRADPQTHASQARHP
jgi:iron complex transport system ATP-binding protein